MKAHKNYSTLRHITVLSLLFLLAACSTGALDESIGSPPKQIGVAIGQASLLNAKPVETYTVTARLVHKCWLNPQKPLIPNHVFFASASRKGGEKAHIGIHRRAKLGRKGPASFAISFVPAGVGTSVSPINYRFEPVLAEKLKQDVSRWMSGDMTCQPMALLSQASTGSDFVPAPASKHKKTSPKKSKK